MWRGPLVCLGQSSVVELDKDQDSQSGIGSLLFLFSGFERKLKELKHIRVLLTVLLALFSCVEANIILMQLWNSIDALLQSAH